MEPTIPVHACALPLEKRNPATPTLSPEAIFRKHAPRVYNLARHMLGNDADAEDVTQDVFLQVVRKLPTFRGEAAFATWLHRVAVNAALACRRKRAFREDHRVADPLGDFQNDRSQRGSVRPRFSSPERQVLDRERHQLIEIALARLPKAYRDVVVLADLEELPNARIATTLGLTVPAVASRLHRGRLLMRKALAPCFEESAA
jgi:RNA polymerase sigma-70 factor (ECF subfamily)